MLQRFRCLLVFVLVALGSGTLFTSHAPQGTSALLEFGSFQVPVQTTFCQFVDPDTNYQVPPFGDLFCEQEYAGLTPCGELSVRSVFAKKYGGNNYWAPLSLRDQTVLTFFDFPIVFTPGVSACGNDYYIYALRRIRI